MASDHCATHANPGTMWLGFIQEYKDQEEVEIIGGTILLKKKIEMSRQKLNSISIISEDVPQDIY